MDEERRRRIRFELGELRAENSQHEFEKLCLAYTQRRICSNVRPSTGPVAAGGDQGRDFETFSTYVVRDPASDVAYRRLVCPEPIAFACTLQQADIGTKIRSDVRKIVAGEPVHAVHFFCEVNVEAAEQHKQQAWARTEHGLQLVIHDGQALATQLAGEDLDDVVRDFLRIPPGFGRSGKALLDVLTEIALADAELIIEAESDGRAAVHLTDLYIERDIEAGILETIGKAAEPGLLLIKSPAGHGKTSLLWRLHGRLSRLPDTHVWLVKGISLLERDPSDLDPFERTVADIRRRRRGPILLIDTADLLLHSESARSSFVALIRMFLDAGCFVIAASRPAEAALLDLPGRTLPPVYLGTYSREELAAAVDTHVRTFYRRAEVYPSEEHLARLQRAVSSGRTLSEVWIIPLTLRMLFYLYTPEHLAEEVDKYDLYNDYWHMRVEKDERAGARLADDAVDCSETAIVVALLMLAEGKPELGRNAIRNVLAGRHLGTADLTRLIARGVLRSSAAGTLSFFHQSFFEYAAGLALVRRKGLEHIRRRIAERPADFFLTAVYEQTLLLAADGLPSERRIADEALAELLGSSEQSLRRSGLYVYTHRHEAPAVRLDVASLAAVPALVVDYLTFASNIESARLDELFETLEELWRSSNSRIQQQLIALLVRLALRDPNRVVRFLDANGVVAAMIAAPRDDIAKRELLRVLEMLAPGHPHWTLRALDAYYRSSRRGSRDLRERVLEILVRQAPVVGAADVASSFRDMTSKRRRSEKELNLLWGELWHIEWTASKASVDDMLAAVGTETDKDAFAHLLGLAKTLIARSAEECRRVWEHFLALPEGPRKWWAQILWSTVFAADSSSEAAAAAREFVAGELRNPASTVRSALLYAITHATLPPEWIRAAFAHSPYDEADGWLSDPAIAGVLPMAFLAGHAGAAAAMQRLADRGASELLTIVLRSLAQHRLDMEEQVRALLQLLLCQRDADPLSDALRHRSTVLRDVLSSRHAEIEAFLLRGLRSHTHDERRSAANVWLTLVEENVIEPPPFAELRAILARESLPAARGMQAHLLGRCAAAKGYDGKLVLDELLAMMGDENLFVRSHVIIGLREAVTRLEYDADAVKRFVNLVLIRPDDQQQISQVGYLIETTARERPKASAAILELLVTAPAVRSLTPRQANRLMNYLRNPVFQCFFKIEQNDRDRLLRLVPSIGDRHLSRLLVEAASVAAFRPSLPALNTLLADPNVDADVKRHIGAQKHRRERTEGSEIWPEIEELIGSTAPS